MMSSWMMHVRPDTSPITFITSAVPSSVRRLSMTASSALRRFAYARARSAPPASGATIVTFGLLHPRQVIDDDRRREQVIDRNVKEPLNLRLVQIHRQHAVRARRAQHVRDQLRRDRHARLVLPILARVAVIRNHGRDARRRRAAERVDHDHQLHDVLIDRCGPVRAGRLHHEDVGPPDVLVDLERDFRVGKPLEPSLPERYAEERRDLARQLRMRTAGKQSSARQIRRPCGDHSSHRQPRRSGWGGRIRTFEYGIQSPAPYRLATPQHPVQLVK